MDCKTAQLLLDYARPRSSELAAADAHALEDHLTVCPECGMLAQNERRVDEHLGTAMRAVEVPDRLRNHLLAKLDAERADWYRQRIGRFLKPVAAGAACLVLAVAAALGSWSLYGYYCRPTPDISAFGNQMVDHMHAPRDRAAVEKEFKTNHGIVTVLPDFNYGYLTGEPSIAAFQGAKVPQMVFNFDIDNGVRETAIVFVLSEKQFNLDNVPASDQASGYAFNVAVQHQPGGPFAYVILYTGKDYKWLKSGQ
jgi:hypothetical protein